MPFFPPLFPLLLLCVGRRQISRKSSALTTALLCTAPLSAIPPPSHSAVSPLPLALSLSLFLSPPPLSHSLSLICLSTLISPSVEGKRAADEGEGQPAAKRSARNEDDDDETAAAMARLEADDEVSPPPPLPLSPLSRAMPRHALFTKSVSSQRRAPGMLLEQKWLRKSRRSGRGSHWLIASLQRSPPSSQAVVQFTKSDMRKLALSLAKKVCAGCSNQGRADGHPFDVLTWSAARDCVLTGAAQPRAQDQVCGRRFEVSAGEDVAAAPMRARRFSCLPIGSRRSLTAPHLSPRLAQGSWIPRWSSCRSSEGSAWPPLVSARWHAVLACFS